MINAVPQLCWALNCECWVMFTLHAGTGSSLMQAGHAPANQHARACVRACLVNPPESPVAAAAFHLLLSLMLQADSPAHMFAALLNFWTADMPSPSPDQQQADAAAHGLGSRSESDLAHDEGQPFAIWMVEARMAMPVVRVQAALGLIQGAVRAANSGQIPLATWQSPMLDQCAVSAAQFGSRLFDRTRLLEVRAIVKGGAPACCSWPDK